MDRNLRVVGELFRENGGARLNYFVSSEDFKLAQKAGFNYYHAFPDINKTYTINVLEVFSRRIPPKTREDYDEFLKEIRLSPNIKISDFALLGYSEVKLPSDGFSIINPYDQADGDCEFLIAIEDIFKVFLVDDFVFLQSEVLKIVCSLFFLKLDKKN